MARGTLYKGADGIYKLRNSITNKLVRKVTGGAASSVAKIAVWGGMAWLAWTGVTTIFSWTFGLALWPVSMAFGLTWWLFGWLIPPALIAGAGFLGWKFRHAIKDMFSGR